jgi:hypothetical protein
MGTSTFAVNVAVSASPWRALLRDKSLQFSFPDAQPLPTTPNWLVGLMIFIRQHYQWFEYTGWALVGIAVLVLAYFLFRGLRRRRNRNADTASTPPPAWQPSAQQARLLLQDADALAEKGRFDEAVHHLLLVSIQEISERRPGQVPPALTSREIAKLPALSVKAQGIFALIAQVVEQCLFGGHAISASEFARCRAAFEQFTIPEIWRVAA